MKFIKNSKSSIILLGSIIIGMIVGLIFKDKTSVLKPFGDLFLNMLLVIIVPLIFTTIVSSIGKLKTPKKMSKVLISIIATFVITSLVSVLIGLGFAKSIKLVDNKNTNAIKEVLKENEKAKKENVNYLEKTVNTITTDNFNNLLSNDNLIALIIFACLFGIALNLSKERGKKLLDIIDDTSYIIQKIIKILMYYAPIGLGCYFAALVGTFGSTLALGYTKMFIIYLVACLFVYFIVYSLYAFLSYGKEGLKSYWKNIIPPTICALATCSSAASIPINTTASKKIGVDSEIADTMIPLGTSFHKDGSIIGSVFKIMFLVYLFNTDASNSKILFTSLLATLLVVAVPIGGGTISEALIITMLGFPLSSLPILTLIATIIDAPATVLNVVGDTASSMITDKIVNKNEKKTLKT